MVGDGDVDLTVYFDFMCPYCGQFDTTNSADMEAMLEEGDVTITYHPVSILDRLSAGSSYSTRAANATAIVADQSPENLTAFITAMYEDQPAEGTSGLSDAEIADIAEGVGVPAAVTATFTDTVDGTFATDAEDVRRPARGGRSPRGSPRRPTRPATTCRSCPPPPCSSTARRSPAGRPPAR